LIGAGEILRICGVGYPRLDRADSIIDRLGEGRHALR
jgi:hypothetical protein